MKDNRKKKFIQVFAIALIMLLIASASYAYFAAQVSDASSTDIIVNTSTVDSLTFETGDAISISATQSNFGSGAGNLADSTYASATLVANNDTNEVSANYYLYIKIDTNQFEYTTSDKTVELILTITDPDGNEVTSLSGLSYTSVTDGEGNTVSGFDITTKTGLITVASEYLIESTGTNTQEWNIKVTLVNLDSDQSDNSGKSFSASLVIQSGVYGNTLQSVYEGYNSKIWAYKSNITKVVFDDSGSTLDDYEEVYDITQHGYCYYDGYPVSNTFNGDSSYSTENSCSNVYYLELFGDSIYLDNSIYSFEDNGVAIWDSDDEVCKTATGEEVYDLLGLELTENSCSGNEVYYLPDADAYIVGIEYVGSGEWKDISSGNIYAYLVSNNDSTYTVYIESDSTIYANEYMNSWFGFFTSLETIEGFDIIDESKVIDMGYMFADCSSLTTLNLSDFDTSSVINMQGVFYNCSSLTSLDFSKADFSSVTSYAGMFSSVPSSITVTVKDSSAYDFITARLSEYNGGTVVIA